MKKLLILLFLFSIFNGFSQKEKLKEYSHTEFFKLIANEKDSIFRLSDAIIRLEKEDSLFLYTKIKDKFVFNKRDTIVINKEINLTNVHFEHHYDLSEFGYSGLIGKAIPFVIFNKDVTISDTSSIIFYGCVFNGTLDIYSETTPEDINLFEKNYDHLSSNSFWIYNSKIQNDVTLDIGNLDIFSPLSLRLIGNKITSKKGYLEVAISSSNIEQLDIQDNTFEGNGFFTLDLDNINYGSVIDTDFNDFRVDLTKVSKNQAQLFTIEDNTFKKPPLASVNQFSTSDTYHWEQWQNNILSIEGYYSYLDKLININDQLELDVLSKNDSIFNAYQTIHKYKIEKSYKNEQQLLGQFYDFYKQKHDSDYANLVYIEIKNLETKRSQFLYQQNPSFEGFFSWKINQFLKAFSAYGTKPAKAVIFSMWVILLFAFIYLLFPNSWESYERKGWMHRFAFFQKYLLRNDGIHTIYLEGKQHKISSYQDFKDNLEKTKLELPRFFVNWTKPLYRASMLSSKFMTSLLKGSDFLTGKWHDLSPKQKRLKNIQIGFLLVLGLLFDVIIKMLNALMLSINTFTTLGFGEIPIKGLPRYLAIIQGFIGWFMLTIFSVSLISQLLN